MGGLERRLHRAEEGERGRAVRELHRRLQAVPTRRIEEFFSFDDGPDPRVLSEWEADGITRELVERATGLEPDTGFEEFVRRLRRLLAPHLERWDRHMQRTRRI